MLLISKATCFGQGNEVDVPELLGHKLVFMGEQNPFEITVDSALLTKKEFNQKKADWTKISFSELDSATLKDLNQKTQLLYNKFLVGIEKSKFLEKHNRTTLRKRIADSLRAENTDYAITFAQARIQGQSVNVESVKGKLLKLTDASGKKKADDGFSLNVERIPNFGKWHVHFNELIDGQIGEVIGPYTDESGGSQTFLKVISRTANELPDSIIDEFLVSFLQSKWRHFGQQTLAKSTLSNVQLQPAYFEYCANAKILSDRDTVAMIDSSAFTIEDLGNYQVAYERFVLSSDSSDFKNHLLNFVVLPKLIAKTSKNLHDAKHSIMNDILNSLEVKFRIEVLFPRIIQEMPVDERDVKELYESDLDRFRLHGNCSYLVAFLTESKYKKDAEKALLKMLESGEYTVDTKKKYDGFSIKFEKDFNLDQSSEKALALRKLSEGIPAQLPLKGYDNRILVVTSKSTTRVIPLTDVYDQLVSEIRYQKTKAIQSAFGKPGK